MEKRGISEIIVSLIIILLVLVAIGIIWIVVINILNKSSEEITIDQFTNNIKIDEAKVGLLTAKVKVTRTQGDATITSLKFILSNGAKIYEYEEKNNLLQTLETKTYEIPLSEGIKPTTIKVIPIFGKTIGIENSITPTTDLTSATNTGLVAYYKFEGDAKDSSGNGNDGICSGADCPTYVNGKVGQSVNLNNSQFITIKDSTYLTNYISFTWIAWVNLTKTNYLNSEEWATIFSKDRYYDEYWFSIYADTTSSPSLIVTRFNQENYKGTSNKKITKDSWQHIAVSWDGSNVKYYINGTLDKTDTTTVRKVNSLGKDLRIGADNGAYYHWNGTLDEIIIFNRSLSDAEIKQIYDSQK